MQKYNKRIFAVFHV